MPTPFAVVFREERREGPSYLTTPDNQFSALLPEAVLWQDSPDPIRASDFYAENRKIKPNAHMVITSHLALGSWQNWEDDRFSIGKLIGYLKVPTYAGAQRPSVIRANIQPAESTTYGSLYETQSPLVVQQGSYTPTGFVDDGLDGYPY